MLKPVALCTKMHYFSSIGCKFAPKSTNNAVDEVKLRIFITGIAGFIGSNTAHELLNKGHEVIGIDNLNDYYDVGLKRARLESFKNVANFEFIEMDLNDDLTEIPNWRDIDVVIHLAAQAGVRYSIKNPFAYSHSNLNGHLKILEFVRNHPTSPLLIYASSSSVYGNNSIAPFSEDANVSNPVSLYAATKIADELMSKTYSHLYGMRQIGLRFFTVYGPWGRPDMAYWGFAEKILNDEPIKVFNYGKLRRDFTYIDDIVKGISKIATTKPSFDDGAPPHKVYNIGNNTPVELMDFIAILEDRLGKKAIMEFLPMQAGDVYETYADTSKLETDYGFKPTTDIATGIENFANWFKIYIGY